jgi:hypothetical protein
VDTHQASVEQTILLRHLEQLVDQALYHSRRNSERARMEHLIFEILVLFDGESCAGGPYSLRPRKEQEPGQAFVLGPEIAGSLHDEWYKFCRYL